MDDQISVYVGMCYDLPIPLTLPLALKEWDSLALVWKKPDPLALAL